MSREHLVHATVFGTNESHATIRVETQTWHTFHAETCQVADLDQHINSLGVLGSLTLIGEVPVHGLRSLLHRTSHLCLVGAPAEYVQICLTEVSKVGRLDLLNCVLPETVEELKGPVALTLRGCTGTAIAQFCSPMSIQLDMPLLEPISSALLKRCRVAFLRGGVWEPCDTFATSAWAVPIDFPATTSHCFLSNISLESECLIHLVTGQLSTVTFQNCFLRNSWTAPPGFRTSLSSLDLDLQSDDSAVLANLIAASPGLRWLRIHPVSLDEEVVSAIESSESIQSLDLSLCLPEDVAELAFPNVREVLLP